MDKPRLSSRFPAAPLASQRRPYRLILAAFAAAALAGCGGESGGPVTPEPSDPNTVSMRDNSFSPASRTVSVGTTVRWVNNGAVPHNSISDDGVWSSGLVQPGESTTHTFNAAGTFPYRCTLHAGMTGTIVVQ